MIPQQMHVAIGTTVVGYDLEQSSAPAEQVVASAFSSAAAACTAEAKDQMQVVAATREVRIHALTLTPHVRIGSVVMCCTIVFEVVPVLIGAPHS